MKKAFGSLSVKRKIWIALSLISLIPILFLLNYFYGGFFYVSFSIKIILILIFIILLGWWLIFETILSFLKVYTRAKKTAKGIGLETSHLPNEVESLENLISALSSKVQESFWQLKELSQKTEDLNRQVLAKVSVFSTILEANALISKKIPSEEVIQFLLQRLQEIFRFKMCVCCLKSNNKDTLKPVACLGVATPLLEEIIEKEKQFFLGLKAITLLDKENSPQQRKSFLGLGINSLIYLPLYFKEGFLGVVILGSHKEQIALSEDDLKVLNLFAQNISLLWEHKRLWRKVEELEIIDDLTDLYNERYIFKRLEEEINRATAYQRPCGFLLLEMKNYFAYQKEFGITETEKFFKRIAKVFRENLRPIDIAGRVEANKLAAILIEKNKRQSEETAFNLKQILENLFKDKISISYTVAESPLNGVSVEDILTCARNSLSSSGKDEAK